MARAPRPRLALDHNFPTPILNALRTYIVDVDLVTLREIDDRLPTLDDRALVIALRQRRFAGLVTNNYKMLKNPRELAAIMATKMTAFAIEGVGDDPLRATGALLLDLPGALRRMDTRRAQVFWMRPRNPQPEDPAVLFERIAKHQQRTVADLFAEVEVSRAELRRAVLD
ncbi:MAG TPA: hypothetical protein VGK49_01000 [Ilumatobacteraceae bacterium]